jgi:hypothetical protein
MARLSVGNPNLHIKVILYGAVRRPKGTSRYENAVTCLRDSIKRQGASCKLNDDVIKCLALFCLQKASACRAGIPH